MITEILIHTRGQGLYEFTDQVDQVLEHSDQSQGLCTLFVQHTSASLLIQENADPTAKHDLENWLCRLVPEEDQNFSHTCEGADDMPAHIKAALTATSISIPVDNNRLLLGTWQGIYLWEHRKSSHKRKVLLHFR